MTDEPQTTAAPQAEPGTERAHHVLRYLVAGGLNTALTWLVYLGLLHTVDYRIAYAIAYLLGILVSYLLNSLYVFRAPLSWQRLAAFPLVYVVQFLLGELLLWAAVDLVHVPRQVAVLAAIILVLPVTYLLSRWLLLKGKHRTQ